MDVGEQDPACAELVELVHQPLGARRAGTIARTATQPSRCSGEMVGLSMPGRERDRVARRAPADVVVHHHVAAGHQDALDAAAEDLEARDGTGSPPRVISTASDSRITSPNTSSPACAQRAAGLDDVGDHVGDAELDAGLDRAVEPGHVGLDAALLEERRDHPDVRRGDAGAGQLVEVGELPGRAGEAEPAAAEAERAAPRRPWRRSRAAGRGR